MWHQLRPNAREVQILVLIEEKNAIINFGGGVF